MSETDASMRNILLDKQQPQKVEAGNRLLSAGSPLKRTEGRPSLQEYVKLEIERKDQPPLTAAPSINVNDLTDGLSSLLNTTDQNGGKPLEGAAGDSTINAASRKATWASQPVTNDSSSNSQKTKTNKTKASTTTVNTASTESSSSKSSNSKSSGEGSSQGSLGSGKNSKCSDGESGIRVTKDDMGAICFKLPGKITHKTTIKLAHYPQPGNEIINIENPGCLPQASAIPLGGEECLGVGNDFPVASGEEGFLMPPEEEVVGECCEVPPPGNYSNNCNFCTYNVNGAGGGCCQPVGVQNYPSPSTLMQHSFQQSAQMQQQMQSYYNTYCGGYGANCNNVGNMYGQYYGNYYYPYQYNHMYGYSNPYCGRRY